MAPILPETGGEYTGAGCQWQGTCEAVSASTNGFYSKQRLDALLDIPAGTRVKFSLLKNDSAIRIFCC